MPWYRIPAVGLLFSLSSACSLLPSAEAPWIHWVCDSQAQVDWRFVDAGQQRVELRLPPSERVYPLTAEVATSGRAFSDGVLALQVQEDQGLVYWVASDDLVGRGCRAP
ncbi:MAG: MliC family protein [Pseudomonas sp.]|uniref:MliC family protein n=1 Tax=Pseudomonas sp. TaxID=306 RepID=UPI003391C98B